MYDFSLVELARSVDFNTYSHIRPICLPSKEEVDYDGNIGTVAGWGVENVGLLQTGQNIVKGFTIFGAAKILQKHDFR